MGPDVLLEDIRAREALAALWVRTDKGLFATMGSDMSCQMGRASERLVTVGPDTEVSLFRRLLASGGTRIRQGWRRHSWRIGCPWCGR